MREHRLRRGLLRRIGVLIRRRMNSPAGRGLHGLALAAAMGMPEGTHVHLQIDRDAKYELVAATVKSLQATGLKVGFINSSSP